MDQETQEPGKPVKFLSEYRIPVTKEEQIEATARLQGLWLRNMEYLLESGSISSTDMATLARVLLHNGWQLDPARLTKNLRDKLTKAVGPLDDLPVEAYGGPRMVG